MSNICKRSVSLFEKIAASCGCDARDRVQTDLIELRTQTNLSTALQALYRQQVNCGFVLGDPQETLAKSHRLIHDPDTGITFRLKWNPDRELRHNRELLVQRGILARDVDRSRLVNRDEQGRSCLLCKANIDAQNPGEILVELQLAGDSFYAGANFAYIGDNHFTLMNAIHRSQHYRRDILAAIHDFVRQTDGVFRVVSNGLAGASIEAHEHLQTTTDEFPIERIRIASGDILSEGSGVRIVKLAYYLPAWLIEADNPEIATSAADVLIREWIDRDGQYHTVNIIGTLQQGRYRTFIVPRDRRRLAGNGKKGAMGAFEVAGDIILSYQPKDGNVQDVDERHLFEDATLKTVKSLFGEIAVSQPF